MGWNREQMGRGAGVESYGGSETVDISSDDHVFSQLARGIIVTASGNVKIGFADGTSQVVPIVVATSGHTLFDGNGKGIWIARIYKTGTTATVLCGLF